MMIEIGDYLVNPAHVMYVHISRSIITNETHPYLTMINGKSLCITGLSLSEIRHLLNNPAVSR